MKDFELVRLESLVERVKVGFVGSINEFYCESENGVPLIRTTDLDDRGINYSNLKYVTKAFHNKNKKSQIRTGDLIIARHGENGKANVFKENFEAQVLNAVIIEPNPKKLESNLIKYFFDSPFIKKQILGGVKGSVQGVINTSLIADLLIPINRKINYSNLSKFISDLDSKIEVNNKISSELEAMAKTIYDYWFVQFDFPNANGKPYKSSGSKMVWSEDLKREVPEGWKVTKMEEWLETNKSGDWGKEEPEGNYSKKVTCIRGTDLNGLNGFGELNPPTRYILDKNTFKVLKPNDIIVEISGGSPTQSTGRMAYITDATIKRFENPLICSNFCKPVTIKNKKLLYNFVYYWNSLYDAGIFFGYEGKTSGIKNLLLDSFIGTYYTVVPEESIINKFYDLMENIQSKKQIYLAENQQINKIRDWLLPMLMNGQVTVGERTK